MPEKNTNSVIFAKMTLCATQKPPFAHKRHFMALYGAMCHTKTSICAKMPLYGAMWHTKMTDIMPPGIYG
jgi:hypothetical protein